MLFDLDGVLANSNATVEGAWRTWALEKGLNVDEILAWSHGRRTADVLERFLPGAPHAPEVARLLAIEHQGIGLVTDVAGAREFIASLDGLPWAIATSGEFEIATSRLRKVGIPIPPVLVTAEKVRHGKPDPEVYLTAAAGLGVDPSRCIVFEDAPAGIEAARLAGARVIALLTTFAASEVRNANAIVRDFRDVRVEHVERGARLQFRSESRAHA